MKIISVHEKVYNLIKQYPELRAILIDLGFEHMKDDAMLNTAGRIMTLSKAARRNKVTYQDYQNALEPHGFKLEEESL